MAKTELKVLSALLLLVALVLIILLFGYAFTGEESMTTSKDEVSPLPYTFVNRLYEGQINQPSESLFMENCGNIDTFINYHDEEPSEQKVIFLDGFYHEPCDCNTNLFINSDAFEPKPKVEKEYTHFNYVPKCSQSFDTFVKQNDYVVTPKNKEELQNFYFYSTCN